MFNCLMFILFLLKNVNNILGILWNFAAGILLTGINQNYWDQPCQDYDLQLH